MKHKLLRIFTYLLSGAACIWLFKLAYAGQDVEQISRYIRELNLFWVAILVVCSLVCHTARTLRWQLLLRACGVEIKLWRLFLALLAGYFVNQALPRGGEVIRCYLLKRSDNTSYATSVGSVVAERFVDTVCLFLLLAGTFLGLHKLSTGFLEAHINTPVKGVLVQLPVWKIFIGLLIFTGVLLIAYRYLNRNLNLLQKRKTLAGKAYSFGSELIKGVTAFLHLKEKSSFLFYTALIWFMYFLMTYLWFFTLPETSHLGAAEALFIWAVGSIGRQVPVQGGGAGAYHYLVIQAFLLFGVSAGVAGTMALVIHGLQTAIYLVLGGLSLVIYFFIPVRAAAKLPQNQRDLNFQNP